MYVCMYVFVRLYRDIQRAHLALPTLSLELKDQMMGAARADAALRASAEDLVDGFKELRLSHGAVGRSAEIAIVRAKQCRSNSRLERGVDLRTPPGQPMAVPAISP